MSCIVFVDGKKLFLNPFMTTLTGNIIDAVARSLKSPEGRCLEFRLQGEDLRFFVDGSEIPLDLGHARQIAGNVLRGLMHSMKGADLGSEFRFVKDQDEVRS